MADCVFCHEAKSAVLVKHVGLDLPFCSIECSDALCSNINAKGLPGVSPSAPKYGDRGRELSGYEEEGQNRRARTERANARVAARAEAMTRLTQVGWDSLPIEVKLLVASHVPLRYFASAQLLGIDREWRYAIRPDPQVWALIYQRLARFLGAPERHALERIGQTPQAVLAYYSMRNYFIGETNEPVLLSRRAVSTLDRLVLRINDSQEGSAYKDRLDQPNQFEELLRLASGLYGPFDPRWSREIHIVIRKYEWMIYRLDGSTGAMTRVQRSDENAIRLHISTHGATINIPSRPDPIDVSNTLIMIFDDMRLVHMSIRGGYDWLSLRLQSATLGYNQYAAGDLWRALPERLNKFGLHEIRFSVPRPAPGTLSVTERLSESTEDWRKLLREARARPSVGDPIVHRASYAPLFGLPSQEEKTWRRTDIAIGLQLVALVPAIDERVPGATGALAFIAYLAFDGPFRVEARAWQDADNNWTMPVPVYDQNNPWPVPAVPSAFSSIKLVIEYLPQTSLVVRDVFRDLTWESLGLRDGWFEEWKARNADWAGAGLTRGQLLPVLLPSYQPVLGEIRFHETGQITALPMESHYFHEYDQWIYLEPGRNPIAKQIAH